MLRTKTTTFLCLAALVMVTAAQAFDCASYKPGNLDDILAMPRPKTGTNMGDLKKFALSVTLESYAETECGMAKLLKFSMSMLPTLYPKGFVETLSMSKCIKVKSTKGSTVFLAIQDRVADFLPGEVPLGTEIKLYCVLVLVSADGPGIVVSEFEAPPAPEKKKGSSRRVPSPRCVAVQ
jgi:hypothetical protein